jgi:hypothetical protein
MSQECGNCKFWQHTPMQDPMRDLKAPAAGLCHRKPPTLVMGQGPRGMMQQMSFFPPTHEHMYCGEHKPAPDIGGNLRVVDTPPPGERSPIAPKPQAR